MVIVMSTEPGEHIEQPLLSDAVIGERVHLLMWPDRTKTQQRLAELLGIDQAAVSKRLRGKTKWSAIEIAMTASWLGVDTCELLAVPPAGFEPAAFCSEDPDEIPQDADATEDESRMADVLPFRRSAPAL